MAWQSPSDIHPETNSKFAPEKLGPPKIGSLIFQPFMDKGRTVSLPECISNITALPEIKSRPLLLAWRTADLEAKPWSSCAMLMNQAAPLQFANEHDMIPISRSIVISTWENQVFRFNLCSPPINTNALFLQHYTNNTPEKKHPNTSDTKISRWIFCAKDA